MTLERSVHTVVRAPRRWLPFAIITASLALGASALAIVASTARPPPRVAHAVVHVTVPTRVVPVVPGYLAWEPQARVMTCPTTDVDPSPHDVREPTTGAAVRVTCIGFRHDGIARGWVMTRGAGPDGVFYTADDGCRWTGVRCDR